ncbi:MAG: hypothetical protein ACOCRX_03215 [Candidatus Woesearchaeota archaeon]
MNLRLICLSIMFFLILLVSNVSCEPFFRSPVFNETITLDDDLSGEIILSELITSPKIELKTPHNNYFINNVSSDGSFLISKDHFEVQGVYQIRFKSGDFLFPKNGWFNVYINEGDTKYKSKLKKYYYNSSTYFCNPFNDSFSCLISHFQTSEINRFSRLYYLTKNESFNETISNLISSNWTESNSNDDCDPRSSFSCGNIFDDEFQFKEYSGAYRQAIIIKDLWESYSFTRNNKIKELAINYTKGSPEECDLYKKDYYCGSSEDQGLMIQAFSKAYQNTLNESYLNILSNLINHSNVSDPSNELINGFQMAQKFITYNISEDLKYMILEYLNDSSTTSLDENKLIRNQVTLSELYRDPTYNDLFYRNNSLNYNIYRKMFDFFLDESSSCNHNNEDFNCINPEVQNNKIKLFFDLSYNILNTNESFYDFRSKSVSVDGESKINIKYHYEVKNPTINIRNYLHTAEPFSSFNLSPSGNFNIPNEFTSGSTFIQVYFSDGDLVYPNNNYFIIPVSLNSPVDEFYDEIFDKNPLNYCSPFSNVSDFSCRYEYIQGDYIKGMNDFFKFNSSEIVLSIIKKLYNAVIDPNLIYSTCDPNLKEYNCVIYTEDPLLSFPSVQRASSLAIGYLNSYKSSGELRLLRDAEKLLLQDWEECSLISNNFNCGKGNQGKLLEAVSLLYELTGNSLYKDWLNEVSDIILLNDYNSSNEIKGLISSYYYLSSNSIDDFLFLNLNTTIERCRDEGCDINLYYDSLGSVWELYKKTTNVTFFDLGSDMISTSPKSSLYCNPLFSYVSPEKYTCEYPDQQGKMISAFTSVKENYVISEIPNLNVTISGIKNDSLNSLTTINCSVKNIDDEGILSRENLHLITPHTLVNPDVNYIEISNLEPGDQFNFSFIVNLTSPGRSNNLCQLLNFQDDLYINVTDIGDFINISYNFYVNEFSNNSLLLNFKNTFDSTLEEVNVTLNNSLEGKFSSFYGELNNSSSIFLDYLENFGVFSSEYYFESLEDGEHEIEVLATSKFDGFTSKNITYRNMKNKIPLDINYSKSLNLYDFDHLNIEIRNNKPFNLTNLSLNLNSTDLLNNDSIKNFNLSINETKNFQYGIQYISFGEIFYNLSLFWEQGLNITKPLNLTVSPEIIGFFSEDSVSINLNEKKEIPVEIKNLASVNQTNLSFEINSSSNLNITNFSFSNFYIGSHWEHNITNSSFNMNNTRLADNLSSKERNISLNWTDSYNFSISFNSSKIPDKSELTLNYELKSNFSGKIFLYQNSSKKITDCVINYSRLEEKCDININSSSLNLGFYFNETGSLNLSFLSINNTNLFLEDRITSTEDSFSVSYLESNESFIFNIEFLIFSDNQHLFLSGDSLENGTGEKIINILKVEEVNEEKKSSSGGGSSLSLTSKVENPEIFFWNYDEVYSFQNLSISKEVISSHFNRNKVYHISSYNDSNLNHTLFSCLNISRRYNISSNLMNLSIKNNCNTSFDYLFFYEPISVSDVNNSILNDYFINSSSPGAILPLKSLNGNKTNSVVYPLNNESFHGLKESYDHIYLHLSFKENLVINVSKLNNFNSSFYNLSFFDKLVSFENSTKYIFGNILYPIISFIVFVVIILLLIPIFFSFIYFYTNLYFYKFKVKKLKNKLNSLLNKNSHLNLNKKNYSKLDKSFYEVNLRIMYLERLIKNKNHSKAEEVSNILGVLFKKVMNEIDSKKQKYTNKQIDIINDLLSGYMTLKEELDSIKKENLRDKKLSKSLEKDNSKSSESSSENEKESNEEPSKEEVEEDKEHFDLYIKILKIKNLIKDNSFDQADEEIKRTEFKIDKLDDIQWKKEKEFLSNELDDLKKSNEKLKKNSKIYKLKKYFNEKKESILMKFKKEEM